MRARALGQDDVSHRPGDDAERHAQADPAQRLDRARERAGVEQRDDQRREGERGDDARSGKQQADLRLFVDETVALGVVVGDGGQPRIEIAAHRLENEAHIQSAERPRGLIQTGGLEAESLSRRSS